MECYHDLPPDAERPCAVCRARRDSFHRMDRRYSNGFRTVAIFVMALVAFVTTLIFLMVLLDTKPSSGGANPSDASTTLPP